MGLSLLVHIICVYQLQCNLINFHLLGDLLYLHVLVCLILWCYFNVFHFPAYDFLNWFPLEHQFVWVTLHHTFLTFLTIIFISITLIFITVLIILGRVKLNCKLEDTTLVWDGIYYKLSSKFFDELMRYHETKATSVSSSTIIDEAEKSKEFLLIFLSNSNTCIFNTYFKYFNLSTSNRIIFIKNCLDENFTWNYYLTLLCKFQCVGLQIQKYLLNPLLVRHYKGWEILRS